MISNLISSGLKVVLKLIVSVLNVIFSGFSFIYLPGFDVYGGWITNFWDLCFEGVGYIRSAFMIGSFEMNLIYLIILIKLSYRPVIAVVKLFVHWWDKLKL